MAKRRLTYLPEAAAEIRELHRTDRALCLIVLQRLSDLRDGRLEGAPLDARVMGDLSDCRKLYFGLKGGQPTHRVVYRQLAGGELEVLEIIAVGPRENLLVYIEAVRRLGRSPSDS